MLRFFKKLFVHPGTWVLGSLVLVGVAIAVPPVAPILVAVAAAGIGMGVITFIPYIGRLWGTLENKSHKAMLWRREHPWQALAIGLGIALFITALVLTIGFFTGGAGFAFMAPVFAALAAPFAAASVSGGVSLVVPALAGFFFVIAPLALANNFKRFLGWLDGFKYDAAAVDDDVKAPAEQSKDWLAY